MNAVRSRRFTSDSIRREKWPELALYLQDEPSDEQRIKNAKRLFGILEQFRKQYPEHKNVRSTTAIGSIGLKALGAHYDIWIAGAGFDERLVKQSKEMKKLLWSYDCNLAPVDAESCRHYFGVWCWKTGIKGCALWAYADPGGTKIQRATRNPNKEWHAKSQRSKGKTANRR